MTNQIEFSKPGKWVMRITADRRIEVNEGVTVTEAAQTVLEAVQKLLEQQTEPVAYINPTKNNVSTDPVHRHNKDCQPLYTYPPQRKPLTDEEIEKLREKTFSTGNPYCPVDSKSMKKAARATEAAHGIEEKP